MSTSTCTIRELRPEDCEQLVRLIQEIAVALKAPDAPQLTAEVLRRDGFGAGKKFSCIVLQDETLSADKNLVGYALYCDKYSSWIGSHIYLEDIYVATTHRKMGYGDQLFKYVAKEAAKTDGCRMDWEVLDWNEGAIQFYKAHGADDSMDKHGMRAMSLDGQKLKDLVCVP